MSEITVTVSGPVGSGKSAVVGEIEIALKAIGIPVRYANRVEEQFEKNVRSADWSRGLSRTPSLHPLPGGRSRWWMTA